MKVLSPILAPEAEGLASEGGTPPEHLALKNSRLECKSSTGLGETETPLLEGSHTLGSTQSRRGWARPPCESWRVSWGGEGWPRITSWGHGHWRQWSERVLIGMSSHRGHHCDIKTWPYPKTYRLQCWNASGQAASRIGTYCYPSADKLSKAVLS